MGWSHHVDGAIAQCWSAISTGSPHTSRVCCGPLDEVPHHDREIVRPPHGRFSPSRVGPRGMGLFPSLDIEKDNIMQLMLGWPFLATIRTLTDVENDELNLRVHEEWVVFKMFTAPTPLCDFECCFKINETEGTRGDTCKLELKTISGNLTPSANFGRLGGVKFREKG